MGETRVLVARCTNMGSETLHVSLHILPSVAFTDLIRHCRLDRRVPTAIDTITVPAV